MKHNIISLAVALLTSSFSLVSLQAQTILTGGFGSGGMGVVNGAAYAKTGTLGSGGFPFVAAARDGSEFYATGSNKLYFINAAATAFDDSLTINLSRLSSQNEANVLFACTGRSLCRLNTASRTVTDSVVLGAPWELTERPNAKEVWVTDSGKVHIIDYTTTLNPTTMTFTSSAYDDSKVAFTPGGATGFKGASFSKKLYRINAASKTITDSVSTAPYGFSNMVVSDDSSKLYVCNPNNNTIRIYNTSSLTIADSITCTMTPINIYRHPTRPEIWVVHHFNDSVSVYNENTSALIASFNISGSPWYIAFGGSGTSGVHCYTQARALKLFPNPAQNEVVLAGLNTGDKVALYTIDGRPVRSVTTAGSTEQLEISSLAAGLYVVTVSNNGATIWSGRFERK
jgi:hypothetical protein